MTAPILLIPGLNCSARLFESQLPVLWRHGPVLVADHRQADTIAALADQILAAAPARFSLVGFSMGGFIAFEILRRCPQRVHRLALLSTSAAPETAGGPGAALREERIKIALGGSFKDIPALHFAKNVHPSRQDDAPLRALHRAMTEDVGARGYVNQQRAIASRPDSRDMLDSIDCPTLVLVGDSDALTPPARAVEMYQGIAGSRLVVVEQCGHLSPLEKPEPVNQALSDLMAD